jgi:heterodisulfide reductase subunit B
MCHNNLDMRQAEYAPGEAPLPALYLTQLMGIAFGLPIEEMHVKAHFVPVEPAISKIG